MALPPEPLALVKVDAVAAAIGEIVAVVSTGPTPPQREGKKGEKDIGNAAPAQELSLRVDTALHGPVVAGQTLTVTKPEGAWIASPGNKGPFLLGAPLVEGGPPVILGRYGPDTWRADDVIAAYKG